MNKIILKVIAFTTLIASFGPTLSYAAPFGYSRDAGFYASLGSGFAFPNTQEGDISAGGISGDFEVESDYGYSFGAGFGYAFSNNLRIELQYAYSTVEVDSVTFGNTTFNSNEDGSAHGFGLRLAYDLFLNDAFYIPTTASLSLGYNDTEFFGDDQNVWSYGIGLGSGVGYQFNKNFAMQFEYGFSVSKASSIDGSFINRFGNRVDVELDPDFDLSHGIGVRLMYFF